MFSEGSIFQKPEDADRIIERTIQILREDYKYNDLEIFRFKSV